MHANLPDFTKASILVVGDVMLDRYWFGNTERISPEAPVPITKINHTHDRPGGAGNVALNIASLGSKVMLMGATGNDAASTALSMQLSQANVHTRLLQLPNIPTITKLRVISRQQQLVRLDFEEKFEKFDYQWLIDTFKAELPNCQLVILSDYGKGTLKPIQELIQLAKSYQKTVLVDPKGSDFSIYQDADIITPNFKEFETIMGLCPTEEILHEKAQAFLEKYKISNLLLTRGARGMSLFQKDDEEIHFQAYAREVFDVTGAGDTVIAVLGSALSAGATLKQSMELANLAASVVVSKLGAASVTTNELKAAFAITPSIVPKGIIDENQLVMTVAAERLKGKKIVFTNGCFDILHNGHITYLTQAKQLGDYLIVAINSDDSVKRLKGNGRPFNSLPERLSILASLNMIDWVISFDENTPERLLKILQPEILVKGGDYQIHEVVGANIVHSYGGEVRVLGAVKGISTSALIQRAQNIKSLETEQ